jgi:hypothetical protein
VTAIDKLAGKLSEDPSTVWRFPGALRGGIASLNILEKDPLTQYALVWASAVRPALDVALDVIGNAITLLELYGGPLAPVAAVADAVVQAAGTAVNVLRQLDQDHAESATLFEKEADRLSTGGKYVGALAQGASALLAATAVPGALRKLAGAVRKEQVLVPKPSAGAKSVEPGTGITDRGRRGTGEPGVERPSSGQIPQPAPASKGIQEKPKPETIWASKKSRAATDPPTGAARGVEAVPGATPRGRIPLAEHASGRTQAPLDWPIVRIDPKRPPDVVPVGTVLEFPNGERVWRTAGSDQGIVIESRLGKGTRRRDFETAYFSRSEMELPGYVKSDLERAHSGAPSLGFESPYAIPYAPREVNQVLQNLGIEEALRALERNRARDVYYRIVTHTRMHPTTRRLSLIEYSVVAVQNNKSTRLFSTGIRVEGTLESPLVSIAGDLTTVHPEALAHLSDDLAYTMEERFRDLIARRAAARR